MLGEPSRTMCVISASLRPAISGFVAMFGPRSPPRPSSPWQPAQLPAHVCFPGASLSAADFCGRRGATASETPSAPTAPTITTPANTKALLHRSREGPLEFCFIRFTANAAAILPRSQTLENNLSADLQNACGIRAGDEPESAVLNSSGLVIGARVESAARSLELRVVPR